MGYEADRPQARTNLDQARVVAKQVIDRLTPGSEAVAIVTTTSPAVPNPTYDLDAAKAIVDRLEQTYALTDMAGALERAHKVAAAAEATGALPTRTLYLLDDSTRHVWLPGDGAALEAVGKQLAGDFSGGIIHFNLGRPNEFNPVVMDLSAGQRLATLVPDFPPSFVARLRAYGQGPDSQLSWRIDDAKADEAGGGSLHLDLSDHMATLGRAAFTGGGPHVVSAALISEDKLPCDDVRWRVVNVASDLKMLVVEGQRQLGGGGSGLYLRSALDPNPDAGGATAAGASPGARTHRLVNIDTISDLELPARPLEEYRCIALCGAGELTDSTAARLEDFVRGGGALWIFVGPQTTADEYNATLLKHHLLPGPLVQRIIVPAGKDATGDGVKFDFDPSRPVHPLLQPFYQAQNSGLENARVFSYWQIDIPAGSTAERVLDYQPVQGSNRKDAAFTVQSLGAGRVIFCSTTADANDEWTAFPAKKAFPEVMLCMFLGTVSTDEQWMNLNVGDKLRPPATLQMTAAPRLRDAAGTDFPLAVSETDQGPVYSSLPLTKPGVYRLNTGSVTYPVVVNVPTAEADTRAVDAEAIRRALGGIDMTFQGDSLPPPEADQAAEGRDFGWPIMLAVLGLAGVESFLAMKFGRYKRTPR
jgi:hypothetical protein